MAQFMILRPWAIILLPGIIFLMWRGAKVVTRGGWQEVMDADLYRFAFQKSSGGGNRFLWGLFSVFVFLSIIGVGHIVENEAGYRADEGWVIAIDASDSMADSLEIGSLKFDRAKAIAKEIINVASPRPVAIMVYSADAYLMAPFNVDYQRMIADLNVFEINMMPLTGTRPDRVVEAAQNLYQQAGLKRQQLILITDGVGNAQAVAKPKMPVNAVLIEPKLTATQQRWLDALVTQTIDYRDIHEVLLPSLMKGLKSGSAWLSLNRRVMDKSYFFVILALMVLAWIMVRE